MTILYYELTDILRGVDKTNANKINKNNTQTHLMVIDLSVRISSTDRGN